MKISDGWTITELAGEYVAVPVGEKASDFKGIVRLNETGLDIWNGLSEGLSCEEISQRLLDEYEGLAPEKAKETVQSVVEKLNKEGLLIG